MRSLFPGMDPYLEHPALWQDVHNRLVAAIADALTPFVAPRYYMGLERRIYLMMSDNFDLCLDYSQPPVSPFSPEDKAWVRELSKSLNG